MRAHRTLLIFLFANFVFFGASAILVGAAVPEIVRDFGWSYTAMGIVLASGSVGYFSSTFLCGIFVRRWGPKRVIVGGLFLQAIGLAFFGSTASLWFNVIALAFIGLGEGGSEVVTNYCLVQIEKDGRSNLMNFMHAAFTAGAIAGPLAVGLLIERNLPWQYAFQGLAFISLIAALAFITQPFKDIDSSAGETQTHRALGHLIRQPALLLLTLVILLYVGAEIGVSNWIAEYFVQVIHTSAATGAYMVSLFWVGLLVGRLLVAAFYHSENQGPLLLMSCLLSTVALVLALLASNIWWTAVCFLGCGIGFSAIYPVIVVLVGHYYAEEQGLAIGLISTGGGIGSFAFPFVMASLADYWGIEWAFWFYAGTTIVMSVGAFIAWTALKRV